MQTMSNEATYNKIIKLYLKYKEYYTSEHKLTEEGRELYNSIKGLRFVLFNGHGEDYSFTIDEKDTNTWKEIFPEAFYRGLTLTVDANNKCLSDAVYQILLDQSKPGVIKPTYESDDCIVFFNTKQSEEINLEYMEEYVDKIMELEPSFNLEQVHDNLVEQGKVAKKP